MDDEGERGERTEYNGDVQTRESRSGSRLTPDALRPRSRVKE